MADSASNAGKTPEAAPAGAAAATTAPGVATGEKWTGGIKDMLLECPAWAVWELYVDWAHWNRWMPTGDFEMVCELREGENGKPGCLRYAEIAPGLWTNERLLAIDAENLSFSYNMEENVFCGGLKGYVGKAQFRELADEKTMMESWTFEVEPLETMTREEFSVFIGGFFTKTLVRGVEAGAKKLANERKSADPTPDSATTI